MYLEVSCLNDFLLVYPTITTFNPLVICRYLRFLRARAISVENRVSGYFQGVAAPPGNPRNFLAFFGGPGYMSWPTKKKNGMFLEKKVFLFKKLGGFLE